jgi:L-alanine-DL-glutamate epimerase-like enolase superfamily enzyme
LRLRARIESWPIAGEFRIARGTKREARVVVVEMEDGDCSGWGESLPYLRYGETPEATVEVLEHRFAGDVPEAALREPTGCAAADNALDCAWWDLEAQRRRRPVWELLGVPRPGSCVTAYTIGLDTPRAMSANASRHAGRQLLKIKLGGTDAGRDGERLRAVRAAAPDATLIADVNEGWSPALLERHLPAAAEVGLALLEQPLPAAEDAALEGLASPVPLGADESVHGEADLAALAERYQVLNVKLDKTGGLTPALALTGRAAELGFELMIGCMVATSLSMAPALLLAGRARYVDLDGPLLLARDRPGGLDYHGSLIGWPAHACWGVPRGGAGGGITEKHS